MAPRDEKWISGTRCPFGYLYPPARARTPGSKKTAWRSPRRAPGSPVSQEDQGSCPLPAMRTHTVPTVTMATADCMQIRSSPTGPFLTCRQNCDVNSEQRVCKTSAGRKWGEAGQPTPVGRATREAGRPQAGLPRGALL